MSLITDTLRGVVNRIEVRTTLGPDIAIDDPFGDQPSVSSAAGAILKPSIVGYNVTGDKTFSITPYGDPGVTKWPLIVFGGGILLAWGLYRAFLR